MSVETGYKAIETIFSAAVSHGFSRVKIKYAGGEPTIRFSVIKELHNLATTYSNNTGIIVDGIILTNGTLLSTKMIQEIKSLNLKLMLSIDGLDEVHDRQRPFVSGLGSFRLVKEKLALLQEQELTPFVTITLTKANLEGLPNLTRWLLAYRTPFTFNFERHASYSTPKFLDDDDLIGALFSAFDVIEKQIPQEKLLAGLVDRANLESAHAATCGVGNNYVVINHRGEISKCQMHVHQSLGNIEEHDPIQVIRTDQRDIINLSVSQKVECQNCTWRFWCTGGCPLQTYIATGHYDLKSPYCEVYKALYPRVLKLEGLRLAKYGKREVYAV
jgi:uncharacterized protein